MSDWPELRLRLQLWLHQSWPFRVIARWLAWGVPQEQGFGNFRGGGPPQDLMNSLLMSQHAPKFLDAFMAALTPADWRCLVHQLLRYKHYGTGPVAGALSSDLRLKEIQNAFIKRITNCLLSRVERK